MEPTAIYATVDLALKHKNRRNSARGRGTGKKVHGPPQRPPPTPPAAYTGNMTLPASVNTTKSPQSTRPPPSEQAPKPPPPRIPKKPSQLLAQLEKNNDNKKKKKSTVPPKPIPYHIYINTKRKMGASCGGVESRGAGGDKENRDTLHRDSDSDDSDD